MAPAISSPPVDPSLPPDELSTIRIYGHTAKLRSCANGDCNGYVFILHGIVTPNKLSITDILKDPTAAWELMNNAPWISAHVAAECLEPNLGRKIFSNGSTSVDLRFLRERLPKSADCNDNAQTDCLAFRLTVANRKLDKYSFITVGSLKPFYSKFSI